MKISVSIDGAHYFHATPTRNMSRIKQHGLVPNVGVRSKKLNETPAIHLFKDKATAEDALMNWLGDEFGENTSLTLIELALPKGLRHHTDPLMSGVELVFDTIPASCIVKIERV